MARNDHDWELKGGGASIPASGSGMGLALWQCQECGLAASRALTDRNNSLNSVLPEPIVDKPCEGPGYDGFYVRGEPAVVDAIVVLNGTRYVLARSEDNAEAVEFRHLPDDQLERIRDEEDVEVYEIDAE